MRTLAAPTRRSRAAVLRPRAAVSALELLAAPVVLSAPLWLVGAACAVVSLCCALFCSALLLLLPTLRAVRSSSDEVRICAGSVIVACAAVEALATDLLATKDQMAAAAAAAAAAPTQSVARLSVAGADAWARARAGLLAASAALTAWAASVLF